MSKIQLAVLAAALAFALTAFAQDKKEGAMPPPPQPSKDLETWMKPVEGSWTCDSKMMAGSMGPGSPEMTGKSKVKIAKDKDTKGMWYRGEFSMPKSKTMPEMSGYFLISHDDTNKQLTSVGYDSMGFASMGTGSLSGDTLTWTGDSVMMGQKMKVRETMTKAGPKTVTHKMEADMGKGFQVMGEDTCTK